MTGTRTRIYHVKTALSNLYDPIHLETHPLVDLLSLRPAPGERAGQALRRVLREAIEALRPNTSYAPGQSEWLSYRILQMRYLQAESVEAICQELALSEATFYRRHRQALDAVASVLWAQVAPAEENAAEIASAETFQAENGREEAVKLARQASREMVNLREVLQDAVRTFLPLAAAQGVTLSLDLPDLLPAACVDAAMLHQIMLNVLVEALRLAAGPSLRLTVRHQGEETTWQLKGLAVEEGAERRLDDSPELALSKSLLQVYGGHIAFADEEDGQALCFTLPCASSATILLIDDDADTIDLYRRYLQTDAYQVRSASCGEEVTAQIQEAIPDLILLDVLMPREDGWKLLQRLKTIPETQPIPVVICSVLSQPRLALALGAARVLQKPVDRQTLLETVRTILGQARPPR
jgi:CheY-like chemotaxis protein